VEVLGNGGAGLRHPKICISDRRRQRVGASSNSSLFLTLWSSLTLLCSARAVPREGCLLGALAACILRSLVDIGSQPFTSSSADAPAAWSRSDSTRILGAAGCTFVVAADVLAQAPI
jgi:hypothetical protein